MKNHNIATFFAAVLCAARPLCADIPEFDLPSALRRISADEIRAAAARATADAYPDADTVILDSVTCEIYEPDGTSVLFDDTYTKIMTEKGRRAESKSSFHFNAFYSEIEIAAAEILKADGSVAPIDLGRNCKLSIDPGMMSSNIYDPDDKVLTVSFPGLEPGDVARVAIRKAEKRARVPGLWCDYQVFEGTDPILRYTYCVSAPETLPIHHQALRDPVEGTLAGSRTVADGGRTIHIWDFENVPQAFPEPSMPPLHTVCQRLLVSTASDWAELSRWYWGLCKPHLDAVSGEMRKTVEGLVEGVLTEQEKIWRIFTWVSQNIRYMGVTTETESPGYEPHDSSVTFERRHGVCRDKAALLASMLRLAGIDAFPVLIHVGEKRDPEVPMNFFNHAIVGVRESAGEYLLMDPTNENSADFLPAYLAGKSYLVATPEGDPLRVSGEVPAAANMVFATTRAKVDVAGKITATTKFDFTGLNDSAYRGALVRRPAEKRRQFLEGVARDTIPGAKLESFSIEPEDLRDTETPLSITISVSAPDFPINGSGATMADIPRFTSAIGYHNFILDSTGLQKRRFPFETEDACGAEEKIEIEFDAMPEAIALPDNISFKTNGITYSQSAFAVTAQDSGKRVLKASSRLEFNLTSYPPSLYRDFKETLHAISRLARQIAVFGQAPTREEITADSRILSREAVYDVTAPGEYTATVTTRRKILTYAGRRAFSELKIPYNPAWQDVEILEASVSNENGRVQLATDSEINTLDAPWAASAPRYPAGKTLVVSLPGVEVGSVVTTSYRITQREAPFFSVATTFNGPTPVDEYTVAMRFTGAAYDELRRRLDRDDGRRVAKTYNLDPGDASCMFDHEDHPDKKTFAIIERVTAPPTLPQETHLPDPAAYAILSAFSLGDWDEYAAALRDAISVATSPSNTVKCAELSNALCSGLTSLEEKITAIRDFVEKNIRLAGPSFTDLPLHATPADTTLTDGYGNLLDHAVLLSALLLDAGIDNNVVFASDTELQETIDGDIAWRLAIPSASTFDYPLVEIAIDDGTLPIYLNDTDQYATLGMTHHYGHHALTTLADDPDIGLLDEEYDADAIGPIKPIFMDTAFEPIATQMTTIDLLANGDATVHVERQVCGVGADAVLKRYAEMTPERLSRHHQELVGEIAVSAVPEGDLEISTNSPPYTVAFTAKVPGFATVTGGTLSIGLPHRTSVSPFQAEERRLPFSLSRSRGAVEAVTVNLPPETRGILSKPAEISWNYEANGFKSFTRTVTEEDGEDGKSITVVTEDSPRNFATYGPEFYKVMLELDRELGRPEASMLVIEVGEGKAPEGPAAASGAGEPTEP